MECWGLCSGAAYLLILRTVLSDGETKLKALAAVHCVIIGFGVERTSKQGLEKTIYDYADVGGEPHSIAAKNINPYLLNGPSIVIRKQSKSISVGAPEMNYGSMPIDNGHLIMSDEERDEIIREYPETKTFIRKYVGGREFLNGTTRWCLWLVDAPVTLIRNCAAIHTRVEMNRKFRQSSSRETTIGLASRPSLLGEIRQPSSQYLLLPKVSSQTRLYLPIGVVSSEIIASGSCLIVPNATNYHLGVLQSQMHMAWMRLTAGRMKSDYQYSNQIVYNNFPWPVEVSEKQQKAVSDAAQLVLDVRLDFKNSPLADLYDPLSMPLQLVKAHQNLDRAVDLAYVASGGKRTWKTESERVEFLFKHYHAITTPVTNQI